MSSQARHHQVNEARIETMQIKLGWFVPTIKRKLPTNKIPFTAQKCYSIQFSSENGTIYLELGENDRIGDELESFGQNGKVIFYILGYAADMNPNDRGEDVETNKLVLLINMGFLIFRIDFRTNISTIYY